MASNVQAGTRGLSASDWIRLKRLRGSRDYLTDQSGDVTNPSPTLLETTKGGRHVFTNFGTSKIRRPASFWTDYRASQTADYVLESQDSETKSRSLNIQKVCRCILPYILTSQTYVAGDRTNNVIEISGSSAGLTIDTPIVFSGLTTCNDILSGVVYYVESTTLSGITIKDKLSGSVITLSSGCDIASSTPTITIVILQDSSAIKHNGLCVKCMT